MLKRLELVGFKSFADKTQFDFPSGLTAIVGPNGSGKSNIVDAVRWVLGEQSAKSLRGGEMADVIFNGSTSRRSFGMAEVTMTFDNSRRQLATETDEVQITRRVYRNSEGEYLINQQPSRLKDIKQLFLGSGAGTDAYCIIEQGRVDVLLQASTKERRTIFRGGGRHQPVQGPEDGNAPQAGASRSGPAASSRYH
jgi:chromosome segregation protein